jgi:hypothetical protein
MDDFELPEGLAGLERELAARTMPEPSADLKERVLAALQEEQTRGESVGAKPLSWRFAAAVAAVLILGFNLSMSAANLADWDVWGEAERPEVASVVRELRHAVPDLSEREALRLALLTRGSSRLVPAPDLTMLRGGSIGAPWASGEPIKRRLRDGPDTHMD